MEAKQLSEPACAQGATVHMQNHTWAKHKRARTHQCPPHCVMEAPRNAADTAWFMAHFVCVCVCAHTHTELHGAVCVCVCVYALAKACMALSPGLGVTRVLALIISTHIAVVCAYMHAYQSSHLGLV